MFSCEPSPSIVVCLMSEEQQQLQRLHSCTVEEQQGVVLRLQRRLRSAQDELDQVRSSLRTLGGADGHGEIQRNLIKRRRVQRNICETSSDLHVVCDAAKQIKMIY